MSTKEENTKWRKDCHQQLKAEQEEHTTIIVFTEDDIRSRPLVVMPQFNPHSLN